jgi:exonuclease VII small subunit
MNIDLSKQEAWRILDAIECYQKDYSVSESCSKTIQNVKKKLKKLVNSNEKEKK